LANPPLPPHPENPPHLHVAGPIQNFIYGSNVVGDQNAAVAQSFYQRHMAEHGAWYWSIHLLVALLAAAIWEGRHWLLHLLK
jgi:hypothetical protein